MKRSCGCCRSWTVSSSQTSPTARKFNEPQSRTVRGSRPASLNTETAPRDGSASHEHAPVGKGGLAGAEAAGSVAIRRLEQCLREYNARHAEVPPRQGRWVVHRRHRRKPRGARRFFVGVRAGAVIATCSWTWGGSCADPADGHSRTMKRGEYRLSVKALGIIVYREVGSRMARTITRDGSPEAVQTATSPLSVDASTGAIPVDRGASAITGPKSTTLSGFCRTSRSAAARTPNTLSSQAIYPARLVRHDLRTLRFHAGGGDTHARRELAAIPCRGVKEGPFWGVAADDCRPDRVHSAVASDSDGRAIIRTAVDLPPVLADSKPAGRMNVRRPCRR